MRLQRCAIVSLLAGCVAAHGATRETLLTSFTYVGVGTGGLYPSAGVVFDEAGNLYGATRDGGAANAGIVFRLKHPGPGSTTWTRTTLHEFAGGNDGQVPLSTLIIDAAGNLYGTTVGGGTDDVGTAFELSPPKADTTAWRHTVLTSFAGLGLNYPNEGLVADRAGNLYGTAEGYLGTDGLHWKNSGVYELSPPTPGKTGWTLSVICKQDGQTICKQADQTIGNSPENRLTIDTAGNLYGTAAGGGIDGGGSVFELSPPPAGTTKWTARVLYHAVAGEVGPFTSFSKLVFDAAGNLYGTSYSGGQYAYGTVYRLSPPKPGQSAWTPTILLSFDVADGYQPETGNLVVDKAGRVFGVTRYGGDDNVGLAFELIPPKRKGDGWLDKTLTSFSGALGVFPNGALTADKSGTIYGTTLLGGIGSGPENYGAGAVFTLKP
jgi:uncharacterized repeat protein (TIGR03803 family)